MDNSSSQASGSGTSLAFTLVADETETLATAQDLRAALEKGTDELKLDTLRRIIISTLNGSPHVSTAWTRSEGVYGGKDGHADESD